MLNQFRTKSFDQMKLKKFYYYSPDKLKLIQIKNFIPKFIAIVLLIAFLITSAMVLFISLSLNSNSKIISNQENIIKKEYEKELNTLKEKYVKLAAEFKELSKTTNDVRLAVNLEPLDLDDRNFGIGGTNFDNYSIWEQSGDNARFPSLDPWSDVPQIFTQDSEYIEDGSYLRVKNISFGYKFNSSFIRSLNIASLRLSANILNLHTFTNYSGYDPNVNGNDLGGLRPGYDFSSYPLARTFMLGISADF